VGDLAGRDLTGADLSSADTRYVDFSGAILNRGNFYDAWARNAHFDKAQLRSANLSWAHLQGAHLDEAQLQGAWLEEAQLQGASLDYAQLQGAQLDFAQLQGASLDSADLQGANLNNAALQGASLSLTAATASMVKVLELYHRVPSLELFAQLQGASLDHAQLQGASLDRAQLQDASLDGASLQGASLDGTSLRGASLRNPCVWRADARMADWREARVVTPNSPAKEVSTDKENKCDWSATSWDKLIDRLKQQIPEGHVRHEAMERLTKRLDPSKPLEGEDEMAKAWALKASLSPTQEDYAKSLTGRWSKMGCAPEGAPYVLHGLVAQLTDPIFPRFHDQSDVTTALAAAFLDEAHCPGAHGLSEADKAKLKKIAAPAAPQAPKP
jgi:uncharacterized protein YjbI with pentapeptide repeats